MAVLAGEIAERSRGWFAALGCTVQVLPSSSPALIIGSSARLGQWRAIGPLPTAAGAAC